MPSRHRGIDRKRTDGLSSPQGIFQVIRIGMNNSESSGRFHSYGQPFLKQIWGRLILDAFVVL